MTIIDNKITEALDLLHKQYGDALEINKEKIEKVSGVGKELDLVFKEQYSERLDVKFENDSMYIEIVSPELVFYDGRSNPFFKVIKAADSFSFFKCGKDSVCTRLVINGAIRLNG